MAERSGVLYVVATPIGNPGDLSPRALRVLSGVGIIAAEDTRRAGRLLADVEDRPRLLSLNAHNCQARLPELLEALQSGADAALISDAGTPGVSDPGGAVVAAAWAQGIRVVPVPGPSAVAAAVSAAGFPAERYVFAGYVPKKPGRRQRYWQWIDDAGETAVLFETPHRIERTLEELAARWPGRLALIARELTKTHEELLRGPLGELREATSGRAWKGEITLVLAAGGKGSAHEAPDADEEDGV
jgi:16S rRNA (cytidine1402-2'-O)-methyltransferase